MDIISLLLIISFFALISLQQKYTNDRLDEIVKNRKLYK